MDIIDRIAAVLRALFADDQAAGRARTTHTGSTGGSASRPTDPDLAAAYDELDDVLGADRDRAGGRGGTQAGPDASGGERRQRGPSLPPDDLKADYANLEVPFGSDIETVRRSYKRLVLHYHPDRNAGNPEKLRIATEITMRINESFERIRAFHERSGPRDR